MKYFVTLAPISVNFNSFFNSFVKNTRNKFNPDVH